MARMLFNINELREGRGEVRLPDVPRERTTQKPHISLRETWATLEQSANPEIGATRKGQLQVPQP